MISWEEHSINSWQQLLLAAGLLVNFNALKLCHSLWNTNQTRFWLCLLQTFRFINTWKTTNVLRGNSWIYLTFSDEMFIFEVKFRRKLLINLWMKKVRVLSYLFSPEWQFFFVFFLAQYITILPFTSPPTPYESMPSREWTIKW